MSSLKDTSCKAANQVDSILVNGSLFTNWFDCVPKDCKIIIFSFFDLQTIPIASAVCKEWNEIMKNSQTLYKLSCHRLWDVKVPDDKVSNWKSAYREIGNES